MKPFIHSFIQIQSKPSLLNSAVLNIFINMVKLLFNMKQYTTLEIHGLKSLLFF